MAPGTSGRKPPWKLNKNFLEQLRSGKFNRPNPAAGVRTDVVKTDGLELPCLILPVYTIRNGQSVRVDGEELTFIPDMQALYHGFLDQPSILRMRRFLQCIDSLSRTRTQYREVVHALSFSELYLCEERDIPYHDGSHRKEKAFTCTICGIVLPMRHMEIDHQRPRSGGDLEALLKTMRAVGLTVAGPHGTKCMQIRELVQRAMDDNSDISHDQEKAMADFWQDFDDGIACDSYPEDVPNTRVPFHPVQPKAARRSDATVGQDSTVQDRYTLNVEGQWLYSFIVAMGLKEMVLERTMNSLANMRPLCGPCNGARGNMGLKCPTT